MSSEGALRKDGSLEGWEVVLVAGRHVKFTNLIEVKESYGKKTNVSPSNCAPFALRMRCQKHGEEITLMVRCASMQLHATRTTTHVA